VESTRQNRIVEAGSDGHGCSFCRSLPCKLLRSELGIEISICGSSGRLAANSYPTGLLSVSGPKEIFSAGQQSATNTHRGRIRISLRHGKHQTAQKTQVSL